MRQRFEAASRPLSNAADLVEVQLVEPGQQADHAHRVALPGRVELPLLLKEGRELLADEKHPVLRLLGPGHDVGRTGQVEQLMRPEPTGHAIPRLHLVEDQRYVVDAGQQP